MTSTSMLLICFQKPLQILPLAEGHWVADQHVPPFGLFDVEADLGPPLGAFLAFLLLGLGGALPFLGLLLAGGAAFLRLLGHPGYLGCSWQRWRTSGRAWKSLASH